MLRFTASCILLDMTFNEKVVQILTERSFELHDGASKLQAIESADFEQIAMDIIEMITRDYGIEIEESKAP